MVQKTGFNIPFGQGLDTKTDPNQVVAGKMLLLQNSIFERGFLQKRNGFPLLTTLPDTDQTTLTTLNGNLIATGTDLLAYNNNAWVNKGVIQPVGLSVVPLVRNSLSVSWTDAAVSNDLTCVIYGDSFSGYYQINDTATGQSIVAQTALPAGSAYGRVFTLGMNFILLFTRDIGGTPSLQYIAIPFATLTPATAVTLSSSVSSITAGFDGVVSNNRLYAIWDGADLGGAVRMIYLTSTLTASAPKIIAGRTGDLVSIAVDETGNTPVIYGTYFESGADTYTIIVNQNLVTVRASTKILTAANMFNITSIAKNGTVYLYYQVPNQYAYAAVETDYIKQQTYTSAGVVGTPAVLLRGVGLASKAFFNSLSVGYMLVAYGQTYQPTYFLIDWLGNVVAKLAYSNALGYQATQILASPNIVTDTASIAYMVADQLTAVNKSQGVANTAGIYAQVGVNIANFNINTSQQSTAEIAQALHLTGGIMWEYDGVKPVEHSFHVWPEDVRVTTSGAGGHLAAQTYFYAITYEWTDSQGMLHRSAPSVPLSIVTTGATSTNTIKVATLRLTAKLAPNPVRIVLYRWSTAQQNYYQVTPILTPTLNSTTVDYVTISDTLADASILGNTLLYTTGGVIENIAATACSDSTLFKSRLMYIDAEDPNLLGYSKQVVQGTPVEFSDVFTQYIAPTAGAQAPTGPMKCLAAMDDKLIIFKKNAIYYITGDGPDATGANNNFSEAVFITSVVGCSNPNSIVATPQGIMFQSDKGIWLLNRNLATEYIGADVEDFNDLTIVSALTIPETTEVRFNDSNGNVLMYDYYMGQWSSFAGVPAVSSTLYQDKHTYLNASGQVKQQSDDSYIDASSPVLQKFTTAWLKLTDLQGFQRAYWFTFLGQYLSPHKLLIEIAYDYDPSIKQSTIVTPDNATARYGDESLYGGGEVYGGGSSIEQWRVFFNKQKCQSIQITVTEIFDSSVGQVAGAGFTMSGINIVVGGKASYPKLPSSKSAG